MLPWTSISSINPLIFIMRVADSSPTGLCWAPRPSHWSQHALPLRPSLKTLHTQAWCASHFVMSGSRVSLSRGRRRVEAQRPVDHRWCYLCLPWGLSVDLFYCGERAPHILTKPHRQNQVGGAWILWPATCTGPGTGHHSEDLWGLGRPEGKVTPLSTLPHCQQELLFKQ